MGEGARTSLTISKSSLLFHNTSKVPKIDCFLTFWLSWVTHSPLTYDYSSIYTFSPALSVSSWDTKDCARGWVLIYLQVSHWLKDRRVYFCSLSLDRQWAEQRDRQGRKLFAQPWCHGRQNQQGLSLEDPQECQGPKKVIEISFSYNEPAGHCACTDPHQKQTTSPVPDIALGT